MIKIEIERKTRKVILPEGLNPLGYDGENLQDTLKFSFIDEFVNGQARLELEFEDNTKTFITLEKENETYTIPITTIMTVEGQVYAQLVVTEGTNEQEIPIFKSKKFYYFVGQSINAETGDREPYIEWIDRANVKLNEVEEALETIDSKIDEIDTAIEETSNLDIDANKVDKTTTVEITKKDNTKKVVQILDGVSLQFMWQGTSLGIKTDNMQDYVFVDLQGVQGVKGDTGEPFRIKKTYFSVAEMNADFNNMEYGDYVMIASSVEIEDNAKLYTRGLSEWIFITDFSGSQGIKGETGATPIIRIGTVTSGATPSVTISGTAEEPILNFVLPKGDKGDKPVKGVDYFTQSDIDSMVAEVTEDATSEFNQNVTAKTNEFNTNTTNKTTDFNTNATAKTTAFNDNATQKTNEFNTNAQNKTDEFNDNVEDLELRLERSEMVYNALPKVEGTGTSLTLNDTANAPMKIIPMASELEQETTTGKNLLPYTNDFIETRNGCTFAGSKGVYTITGNPSIETNFNQHNIVQNYVIKDGDYLHMFNDTTMGGSLVITYSDNTTRSPSFNTANRIFNLSENVGKTIVSIGINAQPTTDFTKLTFKPMIINSSTATDWEQFTFGASPNPEYPQIIHTISGDNEIKEENKNLFDKSLIEDNKYQNASASNTTISSNTNYFISGYQKVKPSTTYTCNVTTNYGCFYDKNKVAIKTVFLNSNTFTTPSNAEYVVVNFKKDTVSITDNIQLELGSSATTYVPHEEQVLPLNLPVKNLFDKTNPFVENWYDADGVEHTSSLTGHCANNIPVKGNTTYTMSGYKIIQDVNQANFQAIYFYDSNGAWISRTAIITTIPYTFTTPANCRYIKFQLSNNRGAFPDEVYSTSLDTFQLEEGTKVNSYSAFGTEPLEVCEIGDYKDEFYLASASDTGLTAGKWYLKKNIGKKIFVSDDITKESTSYVNVTYAKLLKPTDFIGYGNNTFYPLVYTHAVATNSNDYYSANMRNKITPRPNNTTMWVGFEPNATVETMKSDLNNSVLYYPLATPTYIPLNDTLQTQLNNIQKVLAYQNQTNISQVNNDLPFTIKASAIRDMSNIFELIGE